MTPETETPAMITGDMTRKTEIISMDSTHYQIVDDNLVELTQYKTVGFGEIPFQLW